MTKVRNSPIPSGRQAGAPESSEAGEAEMVLVPRVPTAEMIDAAWATALDENAAGVWRDMIEAWLQASSNGKSGSVKG